MPWAATDVALIITTATTALTAISGVVYPLWNSREEKRVRKRQELERSFLDPIMFCLDHADEIGNINRNQRMMLAFAAAGRPADILSKEQSELWNEYGKNVRRIQLLSAQHGIDSRALNLAYLKLPTIEFKFTVDEKGKLTHEGGEIAVDELVAEERAAVATIVEKSREVIQKLKSIPVA